MSAFICADSTFATIYSGLKVYGTSNLWQFSSIRHTVDRMLETTKIKKIETIIDELYTLNARAVSQRYKENNAEMVTGSALLKKTAFNPNVSLYQFLKSLECLHYQMSEGDIPQQMLYKELEKIINAVCSSIAHQAKEYEMAHWD